MNDQEFELLSELYFIQSFEKIKFETGIEEAKLKALLWTMIERQLVKCMLDFDNEVELDREQFESDFSNFHYIATKKGLFLHNSR